MGRKGTEGNGRAKLGSKSRPHPGVSRAALAPAAGSHPPTHLHDVAGAELLRRAHVEDEVGALVGRRRVGRVLHDAGPVMVRVDVVAEVLHPLLPVLSRPSRARRRWHTSIVGETARDGGGGDDERRKEGSS